MSPTAEMEPIVDKNPSSRVAAITAVRTQPDPAPSAPPAPAASSESSMSSEEIATIKKGVLTIIGIYFGLFVLAIMTSKTPATNTPPPAPAATTATTATPAVPAVPAATSAALPTGTGSKRHMQGSTLPQELTVHHLSDQDYSLTWKSMGDGYTYRVYYANDRRMHNAELAYFKPVDGTLYRFTINGEPKNVWMAIAPVNANQQEGLLSRPVNVGKDAVSQ